MKVEVRCCCVPQKLLGWLDVEPERVVVGRVLSFVAPAQWNFTNQFDVMRAPECISARSVNLPVAAITVDGATWLALKSEETPLETLRRIRGFIENT